MTAAGALVNEMHHGTVDLGAEVAEAVQPAFLRTPIEAARPVGQQFPQVTKVCALLPRRARRRLGPPRILDAGPQVRENLLAHPDCERLRPQGSHPASIAGHHHPRHSWHQWGMRGRAASGGAAGCSVGTAEEDGSTMPSEEREQPSSGRTGGPTRSPFPPDTAASRQWACGIRTGITIHLRGAGQAAYHREAAPNEASEFVERTQCL